VIQSLPLVVCFLYGRAWTKVQLIRIRRVKSRRADRPYKTHGIKWRRAELTDLTWTIKPMLTEDMPSWLDLNNQTSVDWRRAKLASLTWTIKPVLTEDMLNWLAWLKQSNEMVYSCQSTVHQASSLLRRRRLFLSYQSHLIIIFVP